MLIQSLPGQEPGAVVVRAGSDGTIGPVILGGHDWTPNLVSGEVTVSLCLEVTCDAPLVLAGTATTDSGGDLHASVTIPSGAVGIGAQIWFSASRSSDPSESAVSAYINRIGDRNISVTYYGSGGGVAIPLGGVGNVYPRYMDALRPITFQGCSNAVGPCTPTTDPPMVAIPGTNGQIPFPGVSYTLNDPATVRMSATQQLGGLPADNPQVYDNGFFLVGPTSVAVNVSPTAGWPAPEVWASVPISGLATGAAGEVTVSAYGPDDSDCSGQPADVKSTDVAPVYIFPGQPLRQDRSLSLELGLPGTYRFIVEYSGDPGDPGRYPPLPPYDASSSACNAADSVMVVDRADSDVDGLVEAEQVVLGDPSSDFATLSGVTDSASGSLDFELFAGGTCAGPPIDTSSVSVDGPGVYTSAPIIPLATGAISWSVSYSGDADNSPAGPDCDAANQVANVVWTPGAVTGLTAAVTGYDQVKVDWSPPASDGGLTIDSYSLTFFDSTNSAVRTESVDASATTATVAGFAPNESFRVEVFAANALGESTTAPTAGPFMPNLPAVPVTTVVATGGPASVLVSWASGMPNMPGVGFELTLSPGGSQQVVGSAVRAASFTGLTWGQSYTVAIRTIAPWQTSAPVPSNSATPANVPDSPVITSVTPKVGGIRLAWTVPASHGFAITRYLIRNVTPGPLFGVERSLAAGTTATTITGLTPGTSYSFTIRARNSVGDSPESAPTVPTKPATGTPSPPLAVVAVAGDATAQVSWSPPADDGGADIDLYRVTATNTATGATTGPRNAGTATTLSIPLTAGQTYTFTVTARNLAGVTSAASAASGAVTVFTKPTRPLALTLTAYRNAVLATWTPPASNGFSPIVGYEVELAATAANGGALLESRSGPSLTQTFTGLTNGTTYRVRVRALNLAGAASPWTGYSSARPLATRPLPPP